MRNFFLTALVFVPMISYGHFAISGIEGDYAGQGEGNLSLRTIVLDDENGIVAASVSTNMLGCFGGFAGTGTLKGNTLQLASSRKEEGADQCVVSISFDKTGKKIKMQEKNCSLYHGAACGFLIGNHFPEAHAMS